MVRLMIRSGSVKSWRSYCLRGQFCSHDEMIASTWGGRQKPQFSDRVIASTGWGPVPFRDDLPVGLAFLKIQGDCRREWLREKDNRRQDGVSSFSFRTKTGNLKLLLWWPGTGHCKSGHLTVCWLGCPCKSWRYFSYSYLVSSALKGNERG